MSFIGKLHEISLYGLITTIICIITNRISLSSLWESKFYFSSFSSFFFTFLFWTSVLYIPIAIIGALSTKYVDNGEGLTFDSDNLFVIIFAHIAEEVLGLILTPMWFIKDLITGKFDVSKIVDYIFWTIEIAYIIINCILLFG